MYAAQGNDGRPWPWGAVGDNDTWGYTHRPNVSHAMTMPPPTAVDAYPSGASPLGVEAMVSGVREWTDVYTDAHMSRAVLRGGSYWSPLPQPAVVGRYFFNHSTDIGYTDGAPNWYYREYTSTLHHTDFPGMATERFRLLAVAANPLEPIEIGAANVNPAATPLTHHTTLVNSSCFNTGRKHYVSTGGHQLRTGYTSWLHKQSPTTIQFPVIMLNGRLPLFSADAIGQYGQIGRDRLPLRRRLVSSSRLGA